MNIFTRWNWLRLGVKYRFRLYLSLWERVNAQIAERSSQAAINDDAVSASSAGTLSPSPSKEKADFETILRERFDIIVAGVEIDDWTLERIVQCARSFLLSASSALRHDIERSLNGFMLMQTAKKRDEIGLSDLEKQLKKDELDFIRTGDEIEASKNRLAALRSNDSASQFTVAGQESQTRFIQNIRAGRAAIFWFVAGMLVVVCEDISAVFFLYNSERDADSNMSLWQALASPASPDNTIAFTALVTGSGMIALTTLAAHFVHKNLAILINDTVSFTRRIFSGIGFALSTLGLAGGCFYLAAVRGDGNGTLGSQISKLLATPAQMAWFLGTLGASLVAAYLLARTSRYVHERATATPQLNTAEIEQAKALGERMIPITQEQDNIRALEGKQKSLRNSIRHTRNRLRWATLHHKFWQWRFNRQQNLLVMNLLFKQRHHLNITVARMRDLALGLAPIRSRDRTESTVHHAQNPPGVSVESTSVMPHTTGQELKPKLIEAVHRNNGHYNQDATAQPPYITQSIGRDGS